MKKDSFSDISHYTAETYLEIGGNCLNGTLQDSGDQFCRLLTVNAN